MIRAAGTIVDDREIVVIGSQSILGLYPDAPRSLTVSMEADVYPRNKPELADLIDGSIGEGSPFHERFGYYGQGVGPETAVLPPGWLDRVVRIGPLAGDTVGLCLDVHDLAIAKAAAWREKDRSFLREAARVGYLRREELRARLELLPSAELRALLAPRLDALFSPVPP